MSAPHFASAQDETPERGFWHRVGGSALLVGVGIGWTSALIACALAAPVSLVISSCDERRRVPHDDL